MEYKNQHGSDASGSTSIPGFTAIPLKDISIPRFNGNNYMEWSFCVKKILSAYNLLEIVECSNEKYSELCLLPQFTQKNEQIILLLISCVDNDFIHYIMTDSARDAWNGLKDQYLNDSAGFRADLFHELSTMSCSSLDQFESHYRNFLNKFETLKSTSVSLDDIACFLFLSSLPDDFSVATSIIKQESRKLTLPFIKAKLQVEVYGNKQNLNNSVNSISSKNVSKQFGTKAGLRNNECAFCHKLGHWKKDCYALKRLNSNKTDNMESASLVTSNNKMVKTQKDSVWFLNNNNNNDDFWYWDTGASVHVCSNIEMLSDYKPSPERYVEVANGEKVLVEGTGKVTFSFNHKGKILYGELSEVLYVPSMHKNLISTRKLASDRNVSITFDSNGCSLISPKGIKIQAGIAEGNLYKCTGKVLTGNANNIDLWHNRLAHVNKHDVQQMLSSDAVKGMNISSSSNYNLCHDCETNKSHRQPFPSGKKRTTRPLELVHSDVCGPFEVSSHRRYKYIVTFIDDYCKYSYVYFIQNKSEVFDCFKRYVAQVENHFSSKGYKVSILRTDNGGEYNSKVFNDFCSEHGIEKQWTVPYNPEQNGVAERYNRTLLEGATTLLSNAKLPKVFWDQAIDYTNYVRNRVINRSNKSTTPFEMYYGYKPDLQHIRIFGCACCCFGKSIFTVELK